MKTPIPALYESWFELKRLIIGRASILIDVGEVELIPFRAVETRDDVILGLYQSGPGAWVSLTQL